MIKVSKQTCDEVLLSKRSTRRGYRQRRIAIWKEIGNFEITEQRFIDQARVIRANEWLTEVELEEIRRKSLTPRDGEEY